MFDSIIEFFKSAIMEQIVNDPFWATLAFIGQVVFGGRFILQWIVSEYKKSLMCRQPFGLCHLQEALFCSVIPST